MTNQKTPEHGGATEEQIEAALSAASRVRREHAEIELERHHRGQDMRECGRICRKCGWQLKPLYAWQSADVEGHDEAVEREAIRAALSASASAHPAGERHDAENGEAESEDHAATVTGDREKLIAEARRWPRAQGLEPSRPPVEVINDLADALAAPIEVDRAHLRKAIAPVLFNSMNYPEPHRMLGKSFGKLERALLDALEVALRCEGSGEGAAPASVRMVGTGVTDDMVERGARASFEEPNASTGEYTWDQMIVDDPSRAEIWRDDARRILIAAVTEPDRD